MLSQEKEGTASVYYSPPDGVAMIIDGGRRGSLTAPRLDGKPVLAFLRTKGVNELVIVCSHPHDDHAAGIREIIRTDKTLTEFSRITFVDSGYPVAQSLYELFRSTHPDYPKDRVQYASARGRDALGASLGRGRLRASNLVEITAPETSEHGNAVVALITLERDGKRIKIVDFDDADTSRVLRFAQWASEDPGSRAPDVVISPHHGSDGTDITPFLHGGLRPKACIVTANARNRFLHPGPVNLRSWVETLGVENVYVTGAAGNIRVDVDGVTAENGRSTREKMLLAVLTPQLSSIEKELTSLEEEISGRTPTKSERDRMDVLRERQAAVLALMRKWEGGEGPNPNVAFGRAPGPPHAGPGAGQPEPPHPSRGGGGGGGGTGGFRDLVRANRLVAPSAPRAVRFRSIMRMRPVFGGIILGNAADERSSRPIRARFNVANGNVELEVVASQGGKEVNGTYDDFTNSELWAAYHIVQPSEEMAVSFGLDETEPGLVGMTENNGDTWEFGIHPAIAGTMLAREAMRLDMRISIDHLRGLKRPIPTYSTYQWFDEKALLTLEDGTVRLAAAEGPPGILMRVRFWKDSWTSSPEAMASEVLSRFRAKYKREPRLEGLDGPRVDAIIRDMTTDQPDAEGESVPYDCAEVVYTLDQTFDAFRRIERLARTVAVLNWIVDGTKQRLPPLPFAVRRPTGTIPPMMKADAVIGELSGAR